MSDDKLHEDPTYQTAQAEIDQRIRKTMLQLPSKEFPAMSTLQERRHYAILQAAATMVSGFWPYVPVSAVIETAREMLAEIERQEDEHA